MGTPMISQIFLRGVYHVNCSRAPIEVREMLSCSPLMREARWDCSPSSTLCQNCLPETETLEFWPTWFGDFSRSGPPLPKGWVRGIETRETRTYSTLLARRRHDTCNP